ncbi:unnamed protein product [Mytilus edulis]|uniref:MULE transposase domain-containing protein n=1 Tax=Mytilus edulis TaxID=6550 RepID=A0A8S3RIV9_MYTED|nr:unnamed protein product [Mytilus edulis]
MQSVSADPTKTCRQVYDDVVVNAGPDRENIPSYSSVKTSLERRRAREIPPVPHSINDVLIEGRWKRTKDGQRFLSLIDNNWGIAIFTTRQALRCLGQCSDIYLDGTFKSVPRPYKQFLTIHGFYQDRVIPFVFALMTTRQVGHYRQIFSHIKRKYARITNNPFAPLRIISDFEVAMTSAAETEFQHASICGCLFHLCQAIWRKVQKLGLTRPYDRNPNLRKCIRKVMAIAYLPLLLVRVNFDQLCRENLTRRLCRRYPALQDLLNYFRRNYMNGQYAVPTWNVYERNMDNRTNNHIESFNRRWNTHVGRRHPNLWFFISKLRHEEVKVKQAIASSDRGDAPPLRKRKYRDLERRIKRLKRSYRSGNRNLTEYWNAMVYVVANFH